MASRDSSALRRGRRPPVSGVRPRRDPCYGRPVTVYDAAFSAATRGASSRSANAIVPFLIDAIEPTSVVDVGCGIGTWLATFKRHGVATVVGFDGPCVRPDELLISLDEFIATDLCKPLPIVRRFDLATSFEVAEHLPEAVAAQFVSSLTKLAPVVAFSAAIPFQGGTGHVNEQWPSYWAAVFAELGYVALDVVRPLVWCNPDVEYSYAQNMLLFVDESGVDRREAPYEVLAGVAIRDRDLWNLVQAIRAAEREYFGTTLGALGVEFKGKTLLKHKVFRLAGQSDSLPSDRRCALAREFLQKGKRETAGGPTESRSRDEFTAYGQAALAFVERIYELCAAFRVRIFASMVAPDAPRPTEDFLRKDYAYLFERYFYYLEDVSDDETGLIVFDELERARCRRLLDQMERYFLHTGRGRFRSGRIVPEPFFVHSDLTTAVQIADIVAYSLNWGLRLQRMCRPTRPELEPFGQHAFNLRYVGERRSETDGKVWPIYGVTYCDRGGSATTIRATKKAKMGSLAGFHQSLHTYLTKSRADYQETATQGLG